MDDRKPAPLLTVKPFFDPTLATLEALPICAAATATVTLIGCTLIVFLIHFVGLGGLISVGALYGTFFVLSLALTPAFYFEIKKSAYRRTVFHFHADRIEYQDFRFFFYRRRGRIRLKDIENVLERASFLQLRKGLTSLYLVIPGFPYVSTSGMPAGLKIPDVREESHLRDRLIEMIEKTLEPAPLPPIPSEDPYPA